MNKKFIDTKWSDELNPANTIFFTHNAAVLNGQYWGSDDGKTYSAESNDERIVIWRNKPTNDKFELIVFCDGRLTIQNAKPHFFTQIP
ncbi:MAG: hypothetical protein LBP19_09690 [Treponema sp.]|jgi:hypothetical protein|nr:hypothetical protein [Treponema sp.]